MTPTGGDPTQKKIMTIMPIAMTFMFLGISSGLAVYFLFSNVFRIFQQIGMNKLHPSEKGDDRKGSEKASRKELNK